MKTLLTSQTNAKEHLLSRKVGALFMEMGTGKTRAAIELVNSIPEVDLVVWIGPYQTIHNPNGVVTEINKWGGFVCPNVVYIGVETIQSSDRQYLNLRKKIETAWRCAIIVDESLKIKNVEAKRTQRLLDYSHLADYKFILNGTPLSRNLLDLWSQMQFLSPLILEMSYPEFKNTFCSWTKVTKIVGKYKQYTKEYITGYENIDYLYSLIKNYVFECDLKLDIKQYYNDVDYIISDEIKEEYKRLKEKYLDNEMLMFKNNNIFLEMTQKMQHLYCCTENKFAKIDELFKQIEQDKTIIFCKYIRSQEECKKRYPKATVLSYQKEGFGLNLQHLPNTIYFDKVWDYALKKQSGARNYRVGNEQDCRYWELTGDVGLETLIDSNIKKKIGMVEYFKSKTIKEIKKAI